MPAVWRRYESKRTVCSAADLWSRRPQNGYRPQASPKEVWGGFCRWFITVILEVTCRVRTRNSGSGREVRL